MTPPGSVGNMSNLCPGPGAGPFLRSANVESRSATVFMTQALRQACKYFISPSTKERPIRLQGPNIGKIDATEIEAECRRLMREADVYRRPNVIAVIG